MTTTEAWTIQRLLKWTTDYLKQHGSDSARLDAEILLAQVKQCQRVFLYTAYEETPSEEERNAFKALVMQRARGMPVAYLVGHKEFFSANFEVTPDVLIPRPETEFIVTELIDLFKEQHANVDSITIADIGTGSGILAICAAMHIAQASVTAVDLSESALEVAKRNAAKHQVESKIEFTQSDLFQNIAADTKFDFIVSNPPYIGETERASLPKDVRDHEPELALFSGADGLDLIRRLIHDVPNYLKSGGTLLVEIDPRQADACAELIQQEGELEFSKFVKDLSGQVRIVCATRK